MISLRYNTIRSYLKLGEQKALAFCMPCGLSNGRESVTVFKSRQSINVIEHDLLILPFVDLGAA
jgi:hypothetical protein